MLMWHHVNRRVIGLDSRVRPTRESDSAVSRVSQIWCRVVQLWMIWFDAVPRLLFVLLGANVATIIYSALNIHFRASFLMVRSPDGWIQN